MGEALGEFVELLTGGIGGMATGIGSGANQFVTDLFFKVNESGVVEGLSHFGGAVAVFGGVGLAVGLTSLIFRWCRSIGN